MKTPAPFRFPGLTPCLALLAMIPTPSSVAEVIGFVERFALADDRAAVLDELIPGTEDYYYYHALHHQNEGRYAEVELLFEPWIKRFGETPRVWEIRNRQALLLYPDQPQKSLAYLRERLGLRFQHQRERLGEKPNLPTELDADRVTWEAFQKRAFAESSILDKVEEAGLDRLLRRDVQLDEKRRRDLLSRLSFPDYPNLVGLIAADLRTRESKGFGEFPIHGLLLPEQLDELAGIRPELATQQRFVHARMAKLAPSEDVDWRRDPEARLAYLERQWDYVRPLPTSFNTLKANVLFHLLEHHRSQGDYPRQLFLDYVKLPRQVHYVEPRWLNREENRGGAQVNLGADLREATRMPPIGPRDEALVRDYLLHLFVEDESWEGFSPYLRDTWLKPLFAEAKIVNGIDDAEKWASLLSPSAFQALRDRIDVEFAPSNAVEFPPGEAVRLEVDVKNVATLMVKVYEVNALNYYLEEQREINTDLNLDGLVANAEQSHQYDEPPLRRVRRSFEFPELGNRRGTWVIEFIGNGISSRALVRKGRLQYLAHPSAAGTVLTVLDSDNRLAEDPAVWFGGRRHTPDDEGRILLPFSNSGGRQPIVLTSGAEVAGQDGSGGLATFEYLQPEAENYELDAAFHIERESLLPGREVTVAVRPRLLLNGRRAPVSVLDKVRLKVAFVDADGIDSTHTVENFKLFDDRESEHVFRVPERVRVVSFVLEAEAEKLSDGGKPVELSTAGSNAGRFALNALDDTAFVGDLHLAKVGGDYVIEVLGKSGEALADRAIQVVLKHNDFRSHIQVPLQSSATGRVILGSLDGIEEILVSGEHLPASRWSLDGDQHSLVETVHAAVGNPIEVPLMANADGDATIEKLTAADIALFERRGGTFTRQVAVSSDSIGVRDGLVIVTGLEAGDYQLVLRSPSAAGRSKGFIIDLRVTEGESTQGYVLGDTRHLQVKNPTPLQIASLDADDETIRIRVANSDAFTRVHVAATHFIPEYPLFPLLEQAPLDGPITIDRGAAESRYVSGRDIGEEYRYILERRDAPKFPGVMLPKPGLILNPWELSRTDTILDEAAAGEEYQKSEEAKASSRGGGARKAKQDAGGPGRDQDRPARSLDFLFHQAPVVYNLAPDEDGVITLKRSDLGDRQHVQVLAVNTANAAYRELALPELDGGTAIRDLRLTRHLDVDQHFSQRRKVTMLGEGEALTIADRRASQLEVYDTLASVYATLSGISGDATLAEFAFILRWPSLDEAQKRSLYSEYASHELHLFLARHDEDFFTTVVAPYLANKKDKTFLDDYLLGADLRGYLEPWRYGRLNAAERALLARRLGGDELAATARHLREGFELIPVDPNREQFWFRQALRGRQGNTAYFGMEADKNGAANAAADPFAAPAEDGVVTRRMAGQLGGGASNRDRMERGAALAEMSDALAVEEAPGAPVPAAAAAAGREFEMAEKKRSVEDQAALGFMMAADFADAEELVDAGKAVRDMRSQVRANFRKLGDTREWAENNYYHLPIAQQIADLIAVNAFWNDFAAWDGDGGFYSQEFPATANSFAEMMLALAVLDLPFEAGEHDFEVEDQSLTLTAASPAVVFHQEIEPVPVADNPPPILVSQNFFREGDRVRYEGNEAVDKFVTDEFLTGVLYGGQVVVTNPTSSNQRLEVLLQIPVGAVPANGSDYTRSKPVQLGAFSTERLEYFFYFPADSGDTDYAHYPVHVSRDEEAIAWGDPFRFTVVDTLSTVDQGSWDYLSQHGSSQQVIDYLKQNNLQRIDLSRIAWRLREDVDFMRAVIGLLEENHAYDATLWSYGLHHNLLPVARQYLLHRDDFLGQSGRWLQTELVSIAPVERHWYQQLDYRPLVNARHHQLGRDRKILNDRFRSQYQQLMHVLSYQTEFGADDQLAISAYLLLQDRVAEGLERFGRVEREQVTSQIQYDYIDAYASLHRGDVETAARLAARYAETPVDRWRDRFDTLATQVREIRGDAPEQPAAPGDADAAGGDSTPDRAQQQEALANTEPTFDFRIEGSRVEVTHRNLDEIRVNYYEMDLEFLFSSNPFVARDSSRFRYIRPNVSETRKIDDAGAADAVLGFNIPQQFRGKNVLVEIVGAGTRKAEAYYANDLNVQVVENYGHLQVRLRDDGQGQALAGAYVKVYARFADGSVRFFKDGYTDLRGKFDYISLNTDELDAVERFALLVISDEHGSLVREATPPQQ